MIFLLTPKQELFEYTNSVVTQSNRKTEPKRFSSFRDERHQHLFCRLSCAVAKYEAAVKKQNKTVLWEHGRTTGRFNILGKTHFFAFLSYTSRIKVTTDTFTLMSEATSKH